MASYRLSRKAADDLGSWQCLNEGNCSGVWWCRAIVLSDRVGSGAEERDSNGDEKIVTEHGHGPQVAEASRLGLAIDWRV